MSTPLQKRIRTYAFQHDCDLDEATLPTLREVVREAAMRSTQEGLYDSLFIFPEQQESKQK